MMNKSRYFIAFVGALSWLILNSAPALAQTRPALEFDGDAYLRCSGNETLNPRQAITLEAWCMIPVSYDGSGNDPLIEKPYTSHDLPAYQYHLGMNSGRFLFDLSLDHVHRQVKSPAGSLVVGQWTHVAATYDGSAMRLYVDAIEVGTYMVSGEIDSFATDLRIGHFGNLPRGIEGWLADVRLWDVARTAQQIQDAMCQGPASNESGLMAHWKLDEGGGQVTADSSPNGHHAIFGSGIIAEDADPVWGVVQIPQCAATSVDPVPYLLGTIEVLAFPNPFNPQVKISFAGATSGAVVVTVHDLTGRRVRTLFAGDQVAGPQSVTWDGRDHRGRPVASGVYLARVVAGPNVGFTKIILGK